MGNNCAKGKLSVLNTPKKDQSFGFKAKPTLNQSSIEQLDIPPSFCETADVSTQTEHKLIKINHATIPKDTFDFQPTSNTNDLENPYPISEFKCLKRRNAFRVEKTQVHSLLGKLSDAATQTSHFIQSDSLMVSSDLSCNPVREFQTLEEKASETESLEEWNLQILKSEINQILRAPQPIALSNNWNQKQEDLTRKQVQEDPSDNRKNKAAKNDVGVSPKSQSSEISAIHINSTNGFHEFRCCGDFETNWNRVEINQKLWLTCERIQMNTYEEVIDDDA
ncbi:unnamed protein product [Hymenolepis diminuta]|uniref:PPP1R35_C domain-containing protein n=1 Tax=Hymenolepis diminuta TaxID=6216 RepID=A0A0R3S8P3_HYMDI|nr:unnamed protein product [Hymenolepis diminuta]